MRFRLYPAITLVFVAALLAVSGPGRTADQRAKNVEIESWWTSASESRALDVLIDRFKQAHPGVTVDNVAVKGGAGSNAQIDLAKRLRAGDPPDLWQTFLGTSLRVYTQRGYIANVSAVFDQTQLAATIPPPVLAAATWNKRQWGVPTGAHRQNMLWFNPALLRKAGVVLPSSGTDAATFMADLKTLKSHGVTPLCLGAKDRFTATELFENILLGIIGSKGWSDIAADRFDWTGKAVRQALGRLGKILDYADPDAGSLTWSAAVERMADGKCAFLSMNDSAYGELIADGVAPADIGHTAYPGTSGKFLALMDTFVVAKETENGQSARQFLATIATAPSELAFSKVKGSAPLRSDVDVSSLPAYQQSAYQALHHETILLSISHGGLLSPQLEQAVYDGVAAFARQHRMAAFINRIQQTTTTPTTGY